jgi:hypothetical protein
VSQGAGRDLLGSAVGMVAVGQLAFGFTDTCTQGSTDACDAAAVVGVVLAALALFWAPGDAAAAGSTTPEVAAVALLAVTAGIGLLAFAGPVAVRIVLQSHEIRGGMADPETAVPGRARHLMLAAAFLAVPASLLVAAPARLWIARHQVELSGESRIP